MIRLLRIAICWVIGCRFGRRRFPYYGRTGASCLRCGRTWLMRQDHDDQDFATPPDLPSDK